MHITKKKIAAVIAATAVVALGSTAAYAYWTAGGSGDGAATTGQTQALSVTGSAAGLAPGLTVPITYTIHNPASFAQHITGVTVAITAFSVHPNDAAQPDCTNNDFTLVTQPVALNADVPAGDSTYTVNAGTIKMIDTNADQNNCQAGNGFTVPLHFVAN
jgi:hypothetical protein